MRHTNFHKILIFGIGIMAKNVFFLKDFPTHIQGNLWSMTGTCGHSGELAVVQGSSQSSRGTCDRLGEHAFTECMVICIVI